MAGVDALHRGQGVELHVVPLSTSMPRITRSKAPFRGDVCAGYKAFFRHIDPCMRYMAGELAAERPPANVMGWIVQQEAGRNDPCPC